MVLRHLDMQLYQMQFTFPLTKFHVLPGAIRTLVSEPPVVKSKHVKVAVKAKLLHSHHTTCDIPSSCMKVGNTVGTHTEMWYMKHFHPVGRSRKL